MMSESRSYYLCNPFTKQWIALPSPSVFEELALGLRSKFGLICEPYCARNGGGNVIDCLCRYRIVRFCYQLVHDSLKGFGVETYYSGTRQWVQSELLDLGEEYSFASSIAAYHGKLHWVGVGGEFLVSYGPFKTGLSSGCISLMSGPNFNPPNDRKNLVKFHVGQCEGVLRVIGIGDRGLSAWDVEEMGDHDNSNARRSLKHNADFKTILVGKEFIRFRHETKDLAVHPMNKDVVYLHTRWGRMFAEYNIQSAELKVEEEGPFDYWKRECNIYQVYPLVLPWWPTPIL